VRCISPTLFKIFLNEALKIWIRKCKYMGVNINEGYISTLFFADEQVITGEDEDDMNYVMRKLTEEYNNWGLEINFDKTQYIVVGGQGQDNSRLWNHQNNESVQIFGSYSYIRRER
jgi:hypothetical protein